MMIQLDAAQSAFREELRSWLSANLTDEFRVAADVHSQTDDSCFETRHAWERKLVDAGWLGVSWPTKYGGRGLDRSYHIIFLAEHFAAGAPLWVSVTGRDLLAPTLIEHAGDDIKDRFLPKIMSSSEFWGQGYSEPNAGSDLASVKTRANLDGDVWRVNGQKVWTSYGHRADWLFVLCRTSDEGRPHQGLSLILLPTDQAGVDIRPIRHLAGGDDFCEVFLTDAIADARHVVGEVGGGWPVVMGSLDDERFVTTMPYQSRFRPQFDDLLQHLAKTHPLNDHTRDRITRQWVELRIIELTNERLLADALAGRPIGARSSMAKLQWATWHRDFAAAALDMIGVDAIAGDRYAGVADIFLNARAETIYGGANEIQKNVVAERVLGLPR